MSPAPLYHPSADHAAYQLRYAWTGWLSAQSLLPEMSAVIDAARSGWEPDGLRALEARCIGDKVQVLFSSTPDVSPSTIAARAKGRIDHAARQCGRPIQFSRAFAVRSVGENSRRDIEAYIERQVAKERYVDTRWRETMERFTLRNNVDLARPATPKRGRY